MRSDEPGFRNIKGLRGFSCPDSVDIVPLLAYVIYGGYWEWGVDRHGWQGETLSRRQAGAAHHGPCRGPQSPGGSAVSRCIVR
jgi:hypothetical protein